MTKDLSLALNKYLSDLAVEYIKLHNLHWNVVGINFKAIHEYLETLYDSISDSFDEVAELLKINNEIPYASMSEYLGIKGIEELGSKDIKSIDALKVVLSDFEYFKCLLEDIRSKADYENLYDIVDKVESDLEHFNKSIWFIKSMLK